MKKIFLFTVVNLFILAVTAQTKVSESNKQASKKTTMIHTLKLGAANAYLLQEGSNMLVDAGSKGNLKELLKQLEKLNCPIATLDYIFITHAHWDHCGNVAQLKKINPAIKVIMQQEDTANVQQSKNAVIKPFRWHTKFYKALFKKPYEGFTPDIIFKDSLSLNNIGINGYLLSTPGHTPGSASLVTNDGSAIIGDLLMGSPLRRKKTIYHLFVDDYTLVNQSIRTLIERDIHTFYVGHYGPLLVKDVFLRIGKKCIYH
jgi:hydroxyacylglutathione hydrolase